MRLLCAIIFVIFASNVIADSSSLNLSVPSPSINYQSDRIKSGEVDCQNAIGGSTNLEFGVTGIINSVNDPLALNYGERTKDVGVYARITIPLDGPKERINCNSLYQLELQKKRLELQKLQQEVTRLQNLQFEK